MRLVQLLSAWRSNGSLEADAIAMDRMLRNMGFRTGIYAKGGTGAALPPEQMPRLTKQDVLLSCHCLCRWSRRAAGTLPDWLGIPWAAAGTLPAPLPACPGKGAGCSFAAAL